MVVASYGTVARDTSATSVSEVPQRSNSNARRYAIVIAAAAGFTLVTLLIAIATNVEDPAVSLESNDAGSARFTELAESIRVWHAAGNTGPVAPPSHALPIDYLSFFTSDMFAEMADSCCKTLWFPPGTSAKLPMDMDLSGEYVMRLRNFVANRNTLMFNGADHYTIDFLNQYFLFNIKQVPVVSGYKRRESLMVLGDPSTPTSIPEAFALEQRVGATYYGGLPNKLAPTKDMVAVDTLSLPGASIIIYNNWPRVPTGTPCFIARYCQIEDPYEEGGKPMKVEVLECPEAASKGFECSCGFINFVGWNWLGSNSNVWESSVVNGDDLALSFGLADKKKAGPQQLSNIVHMATTRVLHQEDCSGGSCHFD